MSCINIYHPDYIKLLSEIDDSIIPFELPTLIRLYQKMNNTDKIPSVSEIYEIDNRTKSQERLNQIQEVFKSNRELANAVYSKLLTNPGISAENLLSLLEKENIVEKDCSGGKLKAEKGLATSFTKGGKWKIYEIFEGKSHKQGGIDINIKNNQISFTNKNGSIKAKYGLVISKDNDYADDGSVFPNNKIVKVNQNNEVKEYNTSSQEYRDLYNSGKLMNYDKNTDTYTATPLKEVVVTAKAPQGLKDTKSRQIDITAETPQWLKDKKSKEVDKINWYESLNYKKWGLNDYSDFSSFNSAFRNSKENKEKEFVYKGIRFNTDLISKEQSDLYHESKKFLQDYYTNQNYKPFKTELPYNIKDMFIKEKFGKTWLEYYNEVVDSDDYKPDSKNFDKVRSELDKLDSYNENNFNNKDYELFVEDYINKERKKQRDIELNNLKEPYYFSITDKKPEDMLENGYLDGRNKKIFLSTNAHKGTLNTTYIHELSHKADNYEVYQRVPNINVDLLNNDSNFRSKYNQENFEYLSNPSEIEARKFSTLFYLYKNKKPYSNISKQDLDDLYEEKDKNLPYDIRQLLDLYSNQKEDLLKYLNNDFSYKNKTKQ